jgi:hypothetical protein
LGRVVSEKRLERNSCLDESDNASVLWRDAVNLSIGAQI